MANLIPVIVCTILVISLASCVFSEEKTAEKMAVSKRGIQCYICNTDIDQDFCEYDTKEKGLKYLQNCSIKATACSTMSFVYKDLKGVSTYVTDRDCSEKATAADMGCITRLGSTGKISNHYCYCEGDGCNGVNQLSSTMSLSVVFSFFVAYIFVR